MIWNRRLALENEFYLQNWRRGKCQNDMVSGGRLGAWAYRGSKDSKWKADAYLHCLTAAKTVHSIHSRKRTTRHCIEFIYATSWSSCSNWYLPILVGAFTKLRKATMSFIVSVRPSIRMEQLGSHWTGFHEIWYLSIFRKKKNSIKSKLY